MALGLIQDTTLKGIADAIREKTGGDQQYTPSEMPTAIQSLEVSSTDYNSLNNKPSINNIELTGNKTTDELGIVIPTKLPNPNALTFTGAVEETYDGSNDVTINIPIGEGSIDDNQISEDTTWSSNKINNEIYLRANAISEETDGQYIEVDDSIDATIEKITIYGSEEGIGTYNEETGKYEITVETRNANLFSPENFVLKNPNENYGYVEYNGKQCFKFTDGGLYGYTYKDKFEENQRYSIGFVNYRPENVVKNIGFTVFFTDGTFVSRAFTPGARAWIVTPEGKTIDRIENGYNYNLDGYVSLEECIVLKGIVSYDAGYENNDIEYIQPQKTSFKLQLETPLYADETQVVLQQLQTFNGTTYIFNYQNANMSVVYNIDTEKAVEQIAYNISTPQQFNSYYTIGDSITLGAFGGATGKQYWTYMKELCNIPITTANGVNSTCISTGDSNVEIEENAFVNRLPNIPSGTDLISIFGGTNDFGRNHPIGSPSDDATNTQTFYGALKYCCEYLLTNFSTSTVFFITPIQRGDLETNDIGKTLEDYVNAIKEVCYEYSIPCIDLYGNLFYPKIPEVVDAYFASDKLHPNVNGQKKMGERLAKFINCNL